MIKNLAEVIESWIREIILECSNDVHFEAKLRDMAVLHERDANRIASLEREILLLKGNPVELESNDDFTVVERLEGIESRLDDLDSCIEDANSTAENAYSECSDLECRIDELENSNHDQIDSDDIEQAIFSATHSALWQDWVVQAVRTEIDAVDFKVTIER